MHYVRIATGPAASHVLFSPLLLLLLFLFLFFFSPPYPLSLSFAMMLTYCSVKMRVCGISGMMVLSSNPKGFRPSRSSQTPLNHKPSTKPKPLGWRRPPVSLSYEPLSHRHLINSRTLVAGITLFYADKLCVINKTQRVLTDTSQLTHHN